VSLERGGHAALQPGPARRSGHRVPVFSARTTSPAGRRYPRGNLLQLPSPAPDTSPVGPAVERPSAERPCHLRRVPRRHCADGAVRDSNGPAPEVPAKHSLAHGVRGGGAVGAHVQRLPRQPWGGSAGRELGRQRVRPVPCDHGRQVPRQPAFTDLCHAWRARVRRVSRQPRYSRRHHRDAGPRQRRGVRQLPHGSGRRWYRGRGNAPAHRLPRNPV